MTTSRTAERLLQFEAQASQLLEELHRLKQETEHYSRAAGTLDQAGSRVTPLVTSLEAIAQGMGEVVGGLRTLGAADLIDRLAAIEKRLEESGTQVSQMGQRLAVLETLGSRTEQRLGALEAKAAETEARSKRLGSQMDALMEYQSKGILGRLFGRVKSP